MKLIPVNEDAVVPVAGASAPVLQLDAGSIMAVARSDGEVAALRFLAPGPYIVISLDRWQRTLSKSVANSEQQAEQVSRQVRRSLARDRAN